MSTSKQSESTPELKQAQQRIVELERRIAKLEAGKEGDADLQAMSLAFYRELSQGCSDAVIESALGVLGRAGGFDRVYLLRNGETPQGDVQIEQAGHWVAETDGDAASPLMYEGNKYSVFFPEWEKRLKGGEAVCGSIKDAPELESLVLLRQGVQSYLWIPLRFEGVWWGVLGFDSQRTEGALDAGFIQAVEPLACGLLASMMHAQLRQSFQQLNWQLELANATGCLGFWCWYPRHDVLELDRSMKDLAGYGDRLFSATRDDWDRVCIDNDGRTLSELVMEQVNSGEKGFELGHHIRHKNGKLLWAMSRCKVDGAGDSLRVIGVTEDLSERREREMILAEARSQADSGKRAKTEFIARMSHEVRTPLNAVIGFATLLRQTELDDEQVGFVKHLEASSKLLLSLVNNILDYSQMEQKRMHLDMRPMDVMNVMESVVKVFSDSVLRKGLSIQLKVTGQLPERVEMDRQRFQQLLYNLLSNAVKFTERGEIRVLAHWKTETLDQGRLQVSVADSGIGIEAERLDAILEPFSQADTHCLSRRFGGSGLGLSIVQTILEAMGAQLEVHSELGKGSTFSFRVPMKILDRKPMRKPSELLNPERMDEAEVRTLRSRRARVKILLAEDNLMNQQVVARMLQRLGFNAVMVNNGRKALDAVKRWDFDLVLMDLMMPVMDGLEASKAIRAELPKEKQPVIVALTANNSSEDRADAKEAGMDDFMSKPVGLQRLERTICEYMELPLVSLGKQDAYAKTIVFESIQPEQDIEQEEKLHFHHIDPDCMRRMVGLDESSDVQDEFICETLDAFFSNADSLMESLQPALESGDWDTFVMNAHSIKGNARSVGAVSLGNLAQQLEVWGKARRADDCMRLINTTEREFRQSCEELRQLRDSLEDYEAQTG